MKYPRIRKLFGKQIWEKGRAELEKGRADEKKWPLLAIKITELICMKLIGKIGESDEKCQEIGHFSSKKAFSSIFLR